MFGARAAKRAKEREESAVQESLYRAWIEDLAQQAIADYSEGVRAHRQLVEEQAIPDSHLVYKKDYPVRSMVGSEYTGYIRDLFFMASVRAARTKPSMVPFGEVIITNQKRDGQRYLCFSIVVRRDILWQ